MKTKRPKRLIITSFLLILSTLLLWGIVLQTISEGDPGLAIVLSVGVILGVLAILPSARQSYVTRPALTGEKAN